MWMSNSRYLTPLATAARNDSSVFSGCVPAEPRCPKARGRAGVKKSVLRCSRISDATGRNLSSSREAANWQWRKNYREDGGPFRSKAASFRGFEAAPGEPAQMADPAQTVTDRHVVHVAELGDRRLARVGRDEVAAEVGQLGQRGLVLILDLLEDRPHARRDCVVLAEFLGQRIDPGAVFLHREVQMRAGRQAGRADISNQLPHMN